MSDAELDKWAAEKVMGYPIKVSKTGVWIEADVDLYIKFTPSADANDDIAVREKWLETADGYQQTDADRILFDTLQSRGFDGKETAWNYRPGDFTRYPRGDGSQMICVITAAVAFLLCLLALCGANDPYDLED